MAGLYEFDSGESVEIRDRDVGNDLLVGKKLQNREAIHSVKFYPNKWISSDETDEVILYLCNTKEQYRHVK